jgi:acetyl-CoA carboxylase biotin carboxyl carrier protein
MNTETQAPQATEQSLQSLCQQAHVLATGLPGALTRLTVMAGPNRVEVEWQATSQAAGGGTATTVLVAEPEATAVSDNAVVAPLVGTFYRSPEPDAAPFVAEGDLVEAGQQVAIVEAMKIMNAVQTDQAGRVAKILAKDGDMVEFGQQLMIIESADAES